jgi:ABC-2 type transport system ATP-binding protein
MTTLSSVVRIERLKKSFRNVKAVDGIDLEVGAGELVGLIGPNGAGKSTTVKILTGQLLADAGRVVVRGEDVLTHAFAARQAIGYVPQDLDLHPFLTGRELLEFVAEVREIPAPTAKERIDRLLQRFGIAVAQHRMVREYSEGMARKLAICAALVGEPPLLVLDESLNGLDPRAAAEVKAVLTEELARGTAIILVSHILDILERLCHRIVLIDGGRVVGNLTRPELDAMRNKGVTLEEYFISHTAAPEPP